MAKTLIVSLGTNSYFSREAKRLEWSLNKHGEENRIFYGGKYPEGSPKQNEIPMGYKPYMMQQAFDEGYDMVFWLDSKMTILKPFDGIWEHIEKEGAFFTFNGWKVGHWASDNALKWLGITRQEAFEIPDISSGVVGLHKRNREWLDEWERSSKDKIWNVKSRLPFKGLKLDGKQKTQFGARGEQPCASALAERFDLPRMQKRGWWTYEHAPITGTEYFICSRMPAKGPDKEKRTWAKDFWLPPDEK